MGDITSYEAAWIEKRMLGFIERDAMFSLVFEVFSFIPFKVRFTHGLRIVEIWLFRHIWVLMAMG